MAILANQYFSYSFREISDTLEEGWQLDEPQRKKIIKRLLLKWHPDKNIGNEEFCTKVVHFIQSEIERLEQGIPRHDPSFTSNFEVSIITRLLSPYVRSQIYRRFVVHRIWPSSKN